MSDIADRILGWLVVGALVVTYALVYDPGMPSGHARRWRHNHPYEYAIGQMCANGHGNARLEVSGDPAPPNRFAVIAKMAAAYAYSLDDNKPPPKRAAAHAQALQNETALVALGEQGMQQPATAVAQLQALDSQIAPLVEAQRRFYRSVGVGNPCYGRWPRPSA